MPGYRRGRSQGFTAKNPGPRRSVPNAGTPVAEPAMQIGPPPGGGRPV